MARLSTRGWIFVKEFIQSPFDGFSIYSKSPFTGTVNHEWREKEEGLFILKLTFDQQDSIVSNPMKLVWRVPAINLKGMWTSNYETDRRVRAEFDGEDVVVARAAYESPVISLFGHDDSNIHTFACSDGMNMVSLGAGLREEDGWVYCNIKFFIEPTPVDLNYTVEILLDYRGVDYSKSLTEVSCWWASQDKYPPMNAPNIAKLPMYSTWYSYHQGMTEEGLLEESRLASELGYSGIIIDDGWQNTDTHRGYAYTGDWKAKRFEDTTRLIKDIQALGMKVMFWYSVPFFGRQSEAFKQFEGKFLHWSDEFDAAIIDPRYPEIREYLIEIYVLAVRKWGLDGLKLDFIDHIITYPDTELTAENGRDYASVQVAVCRLLTDVRIALTAEKPDIMIEFRQHYIGPVMRSCGNIFRAHDCPNDAVSNRKRIIDLRLLMGDSAVHSDMVMWNYDEPVETAALQMSNVFFSVPQLSVRLNRITHEQKKMLQFYTKYWLENRSILLDEKLTAIRPLEGYPLITAKSGNKRIVVVFDDYVINQLDGHEEAIDLVNAKLTDSLVLNIESNMGSFNMEIIDCQGESISNNWIVLNQGVIKLIAPASGIVKLRLGNSFRNG